MKNILLIGLGGTIACSKTGNSLQPKYGPEFLLEKINTSHIIKTTQLLTRTIVYPEDWITLANYIDKNKEKYDSFVITMGTDTLAYTSSMLSYMLIGIDKPIAITGAMIPMEESNTDAIKNLSDSFNMELPGVHVVFNNKVILGVRASKIITNDINAFDQIRKPSMFEQLPYNLDNKINTDVLTVKLTPNTTEDIFKSNHDAYFIEGYGDGNISDNLIDPIGDLIIKNRIVLISSQCPYGEVEHKYKGGYTLINEGAISTKDMTKEAALTKLMWLMGKTLDPKIIKKEMHKNYCGEITN